MKMRTLLSASIALALFGTCASASDTVQIDFDGTATTNGTVDVGSLDWAVGSSLADGGLLAQQEGDTFEIYSHAALAGYLDENGVIKGVDGLNGSNPDTNFEWTFIFGATESLSDNFDVAQSLLNLGDDGVAGGGDDIYQIEGSFNFTGDSQTNNDGFFFEIYYDDTPDHNPLDGTGFDNGDLIMSASSLDSISGNFDSVLFYFEDLNNNGTIDSNELVSYDADLGNKNDPAAFLEDAAYPTLDDFGDDNWSDADTTYLSVTGEGATSLTASVDEATLDGDFFETTLTKIITDLLFNTSNVTPYDETNPSMSYDCDGLTATGPGTCDDGTLSLSDGEIILSSLDGLTTADGTSLDGSLVNGTAAEFAGNERGDDILFQTDANQAFLVTVREVPEPGTMALLGLGLGFLGLSNRRRRRHQA